MNKTRIDWADYTWNPVSGCTKVSEGCRHCYAERHAIRFWGERKFSDVRCHAEKLSDPMKVQEPAYIFVNSMSDLFHPDVPPEFIDDVLGIIKACPQHTFIILTKRPENIKEKVFGAPEIPARMLGGGDHFPPNIWLGVSVEDQMSAERRIPILLETLAALHFVSIEPMLGPVNLEDMCPRNTSINALAGRKFIKSPNGNEAMMLPLAQSLEWVICGGESGAGARPMQAKWARDLRDQCGRYGTPFFFKQWGGGRKNGHLLDEVEWHQKPVVAR